MVLAEAVDEAVVRQGGAGMKLDLVLSVLGWIAVAAILAVLIVGIVVLYVDAGSSIVSEACP